MLVGDSTRESMMKKKSNRSRPMKDSITKRRACATCGELYRPTGTTQKYCSVECKSAGRDRRALKHTETRNKVIIHARDKFLCYMCGKSSWSNGVELDLDHIVPFALGGRDVIGNILTSCVACNRSRQDLRFSEELERDLLAEAKARCIKIGLDPEQYIRIAR